MTEYCEGGNLSQYTKANCPTISDKVRIFRQSASGVAFLHHAGVIHRDLKPSNILIKKVDGTDTVKIADFGMADTSRRNTMTTVGGSMHYMAPELWVPDAKYKKAVDVYALGVLDIHLIRVNPKQELDCAQGLYL